MLIYFGYFNSFFSGEKSVIFRVLSSISLTKLPYCFTVLALISFQSLSAINPSLPFSLYTHLFTQAGKQPLFFIESRFQDWHNWWIGCSVTIFSRETFWIKAKQPENINNMNTGYMIMLSKTDQLILSISCKIQYSFKEAKKNISLHQKHLVIR